MRMIPVFPDILAAHARIKPYIRQTPVLTCAALDSMSRARLFFKAENFQKTGSFKYRGATNAVRSLPDEAARKGVATHSSGNHAQALALAARLRGAAAHVVMPLDAPTAKRAAVLGYGGKVTPCASTLQAREDGLKEVVERTGAVYVPSYDHPAIIAGQGTAALELLKEVPNLDAVVAPLGGGGLFSGTAIATHGLRSRAKVYGAEPEQADDAYWSLERGRIMPAKPAKTVADGLRTQLSEMTFKILQEEAEAVLRAAESEIIFAMRLLWERAKVVVEPSGAAALAVVLREPDRFKDRRVGVILSGGNIDLTVEKLAEYFRGVEPPLP